MLINNVINHVKLKTQSIKKITHIFPHKLFNNVISHYNNNVNIILSIILLLNSKD